MVSRKKSSVKHLVSVFIITFIIAVLVSGGSEAFLRYFPPYVTWLFLLIVISIGIIFDILGIAVTAADEAPHHARAADKVFGARQSVFLLKRADKVSSFANDIVGDVTGTLSGAMGATIIVNIIQTYSYPQSWKLLLNILMLAAIA
ncbi:MAG: hypothetical protein WCR27_06900, partial [Eubacteriales bacterium]